jgi:hypothetical protein
MDGPTTPTMHGDPERGAGGGQTLLLAAMIVAIGVLAVILIFKLTSSGGSDETAPTSTASPLGPAGVISPVGAAADVSTQSDLSVAIGVAANYFVDSGTYVGFTASEAARDEPSLRYSDGGAAQVGVVSIRGATQTTVVLVERSASGQVFCEANTGGQAVMGRTDAQTAESCTGGW